MSRRVLLRPQAEAELIATGQWYDERWAGLGDDFVEAVTDAVSRIADSPLAFPRVHGETRRAVLRRYPYAVYFRIVSDDIIVLAIHGRQNPQRWQRRR